MFGRRRCETRSVFFLPRNSLIFAANPKIRIMADNNLGDLNSILHIKTDPSEIAAAQQQLNAIFGTAQQGLNAINDGIAKIQKVTSLGILGGGLAGIVHQVFQTRSYFQDAASSMKTFLGDADKAAKFTKELQDYAFYNMFEFQDLVGVSKQLIAYGTTDTKEIIKVTDQLSNIATGTGANINEMVYIYNKIKAQGKLQGDELNQLASRGLVVKDVLKEMGETVNGNNVTFEQFQKVLTHVTSEGGMFHDLMKDQLNNLSASAAQLSDNMTNLWNTVGETLEPVMKEAIDLAGFLIEKGTEGFESIQAYLFDIAKAYGIYKVVDAGMSWNAENKEQERAKSVEKVTSALEEAAEATKNIENADLQAAVAKKKLTAQEAAEVAELRKRVSEENKAKIASGELTKEEAKKIAATKEGLKLREIELKKVLEQSQGELAAINDEIAALEKKIAAQKAAANAVGGTGASGISAETAALKLKDLEQQKHNLTLAQTAAAERQAAATTGIATIQQAQNTAALAQNEKARGIWARGMTAAGSALKGIGSSIVEMINPTGMLIAAVGFLVENLIEAAVRGSSMEQALGRLDGAMDDMTASMNEEIIKLSEAATILKTAKEDTEEYAKAKETVVDMANQYNIATDETVDGIKKEMDAIDLVTKKYDEYLKKIEEVYNRKAYDAFVADEKENILAKAKDATATIREQMSDALLDGITDPQEKGMMMAKIQKAMAELSLKMQQGAISGSMSSETGINITGLSQETDDLMKEYMQKMGYWTTAMNGLKGGWSSLMGWVSGDLTWDEGNAMKSGKQYSQFLIATAMKDIQASLSAISAAKTAFGIDDTGDKETDNDGKSAKQTVTHQIKKAKEDAKKYIEEYAKIMNDFRKEKRKIDTDVNMSDEERSARLAKLNTNIGQDVAELDSQYAERIKDPKKMEALRTAYETAADVEIETARAQNVRVQGEIAKLQKQSEDLQSRQDKDPNDPSKKATDAQRQAVTATINQNQERIALLTAEAEGYQRVIDKDKEWEKNFKRIHEITKQENDKFLDDQVKKQRDIAENYKKLRKELYIMLEDGQIGNEQYNQLLFQTNLNEEKARQQEYINIYGGYYAKREELTRVWEQRLANVPPEYFNVAKQKMVEELSKMNFDQFKQNLNWDAIFGDLSHQSARAIKENIDSLKAAFEAEKGNMGIDEIKTVTEALTKLDDELNKRNPWRAMVQSIKAMKAAAKELPQLTEKHTQAQKDLNEATAEYKRISEELKALQQQLSNPDLSDEQRAKIQTEINKKLKEQGKALANVTEKEKEAAQAQKALNEEQDKASKAPNDWIQGWQDVSKGIADAGNALAQFDGKLGEIGSVMANIGSELQNAFSSIKSGDMYSTISTAVTSIVGIVSTISNSRKKARQEEKEWALAQQRFADNMQLAEVQNTRLATKNKENIFGVRDYMGEAQDAVDAYKLAQKKLSEQIDKLDKEGKAKKGQRDGVDWGAVGKTTGKGAAAGAAIGTAIGGWALGLGTVIGGAIGAVGGFFSGLFGGKKKKTQWGGLLEQYPELVERAADGEERINMELAEQLIQQGIVNDETKEMLETAKGYQEEMDAANEQISSIVSDLTGSLGQNLKNALVDAFVAGEDAAETFKKSVDTMLEDMIADLMFTAAFSDLFDELGEKYKAIFKGGGTIEDIVNATNEFMDEGAARSQLYVDGLAAVQKAANENGGHNLWQSAQERQAVSGGIANVTQDTAEEVNGRLTQIQSHTFSINENMKMLVNMQTTQLTILQGIHTDTGQLHAIKASITHLEAAVDDMQIRGIKLKA